MDTKVWTDADGYKVEIYMGEIVKEPKIRVSLPGKSGDNCSQFSWATKIEAVIPAYAKALSGQGKDPRDYRMVSGLVIRIAALPFIEAALAELHVEHTQGQARLLRNVPGLVELRAAREDESRYAGQFERMMEDEYNDGARPPQPVRVPAAQLAAAYPVAAAYLKAESWEYAAHYAKGSAGRKAKARIAAGEPYAEVIEEMEAEWSAHCDAHVWD